MTVSSAPPGTEFIRHFLNDRAGSSQRSQGVRSLTLPAATAADHGNCRILVSHFGCDAALRLRRRTLLESPATMLYRPSLLALLAACALPTAKVHADDV